MISWPQQVIERTQTCYKFSVHDNICGLESSCIPPSSLEFLPRLSPSLSQRIYLCFLSPKDRFSGMNVFTYVHQLYKCMWYFTKFQKKNSARLHTIINELRFSCHSRKVLTWTKILRHVEVMHGFNNLFIYGWVYSQSLSVCRVLKILWRDLLSLRIGRCFSQAANERLGNIWPIEKRLLSMGWGRFSASNGNVWNIFSSFLLL